MPQRAQLRRIPGEIVGHSFWWDARFSRRYSSAIL